MPMNAVPGWLVGSFAGVLGLVVGSFLNVVIHRVPRGQSVVAPRSHCPACGNGVRPRDEIPVLSWLLLRARCRDCGAIISARYPLIELGTAVLFVALAVKFEASSTLPAYLYLAAVCVALAVIDLDTKRLPDVLTLPSYPIGVVLLAVASALTGEWSPLLRGLIGLAAMWSFYFALRFAYPQGMGYGDVKLAGLLGLYTGFLGWDVWTVALFGGFALGGVVSIGLVLAGCAGRKSKVPYGPFMVVGAVLAILAGQPLASAYLDVTVR